MDEEILNEITEDSGFSYEYPIIDQNNEEILNPDLDLGYLRKEIFTVHHPSVPEEWHYKVVSFDFSKIDFSKQAILKIDYIDGISKSFFLDFKDYM